MPESFVSSVVSVPPGSLLGLFAPVGKAGLKRRCRQARYSGYSRRWWKAGLKRRCRRWLVKRRCRHGALVSVPSFLWSLVSVPSFCWSLVPLPCAAEPLEPGSATATAPPAPISRPAASTQTPAAKRKRSTRTSCSLLPTSHRRLAEQSQRFATLSHSPTIAGIGQQAKYVHSTVSSNTCLDVRYVDERGELCRR